MLNQQQVAMVGEKVEGRVRIDVLDDHIIRIRYAEGAQVPENATPHGGRGVRRTVTLHDHHGRRHHAVDAG